MSATKKRIVALAGGVGGAKLAHGLALTGLEDRLAVVVNTADDFELLGLHISPDLDTVLYTLSGLANPETGWGIAGDTFQHARSHQALWRTELVLARRSRLRHPHLTYRPFAFRPVH